MSERPTPETDSQIKTFTSVSKLKKSFENRTGTVSAGFARKLERERDEALAAIVGWENKWKCAVEMAAQAEVERDEAREAAAMERAGAEQARRADENREWALRAERERDEARGKYRAAVINRKRECFKLHREIKDLSRQLDAIRTVFKNKAHENWEPGETLAETGARILRERDEAREALENHTASTTHSCHDQCQRPMCVLRRELDKERERAKELAELVDGSYIFVELHKPDCEYNKKWRVAWMEKAKRLIPGVDSIWY